MFRIWVFLGWLDWKLAGTPWHQRRIWRRVFLYYGPLRTDKSREQVVQFIADAYVNYALRTRKEIEESRL